MREKISLITPNGEKIRLTPQMGEDEEKLDGLTASIRQDTEGGYYCKQAIIRFIPPVTFGGRVMKEAELEITFPSH